MNTATLVIGIVGCVFLALNIVFIAVIISNRRKMNAVEGWASTMGTIMMSQIEERRSGNDNGWTDYPVVQYSYQVGGQAYQSMKLAPGPEVGGSGARGVVAKYPAGSQVMVYFDPNNPSDAVLEKKARAQWLMWILLAVFDCVLCGVMPIIWFAFANQ